MLKRPKEKVFDWPQPKELYPPSQRSGALIGPSGSGKTTSAISMLTGHYKDVRSRVYIMSPSCAPGIDPAWDAWRKHVKEYMKVPEDEVTMWSTWSPVELEKRIARHAKVNAHLKAQGNKKWIRDRLPYRRFCGPGRQGPTQQHQCPHESLCPGSPPGLRLLVT